MIRDWTVRCKDCLEIFTYSDTSARESAIRGESRPERCTACRAKHNRDTSRMGAAYVELEPGARPVTAGRLKAGRLGRLDRGERPHQPDNEESPSIAAGTFGITDEHVRQLLTAMEQHQVVVVEAPTGSGKSTFLPWRLLNPPSPHPRDAVTRHGLIVVTQPRIEATQGIPRYIAEKLHGAKVGAGVDIGFRHSAARDQADSRNRLVYATDGTLLNMIRRGELQDCSTVILDEAHERSLNIDLILALMRRELMALPQLRLLIASATIDTAAFTEFFRPELRSTSMAFPGKDGKPVYDRWRAAAAIPEIQWPARMPGEVARTAHEVLRWMACAERPADIPVDVPAHDGDILAFLPGKRAINAAIDELDELISEDDDLAGKVELLPLYAELPQRERTRALRADRRRKGARWRVVVTTNIAETSLTVDGISHVIDSGLINTTEWDAATLTTVVRPRPHSQSGLRQRRGRAGRTAPGVWHCLFSQEQFAALTFETPPEIVRAPLENVVLAAAAAGVSDPASLRWMPPGPPEEEVRRARATLRGMGAITPDGDPTALGHELASSRESFSAASVLMCADEAGVAVEAATILAAMQEQRWAKMLRWSSAWPAITRLHADRMLATLLSGCADDLDATLMLVHEWENTAQQHREAMADRYLLSIATFNAVLRRRDELLQSLQSRTKTTEVRSLDLRLSDRLRRVIAWAGPNAIYRNLNGEWQPALVPRADPDVVTRLHEGARPAVGSDSLLARRTPPPFLVAPVRDRRRHWISPLQEPEDRVTLSFCIALRENHLAGDVPLLTHIAGHPHIAAIRPPTVLPGDRLLVEPVGERRDGVQVRVLIPQPPVPVPDVELAAEERTVEESGDLAQRTAASNDTSGLDVDPLNAADFLNPDEDGSLVDDAHDDADEAPVNPYAELEVVTSAFDPAHPVVVVTGFAEGTVLAGPDPIAAAERFAQRFLPGDQCTVEVTDIRTLQRDRRRVVITREPETGVEIPLTSLDLGFGLRDASLDAFPVGTHLTLAVVVADPETGLIQLSALPDIAATLSRLAQTTPEPFSGTIVDAYSESIHVMLIPDGLRLRDDDPPITIEVRSDDLPPRPTEMALGQQVRVRLSSRKPRVVAVDIDLRSLRVPTGPFERAGRTLTLTGAAAAGDVLAIYRATRGLTLGDAVALHRAVSSLLVRKLRPRARIIDVTGLTQLRNQNQVTARVASVSDKQITVEAEGGTWATIPRAQLAWPGQPAPALARNEIVGVFVADVVPEEGRVVLTMRNPNANPYVGLSGNDVLAGRVTDADKAGIRLAISDPAVEVFVPSSETGVRGDEIPATFPVGSQMRVRLMEVDKDRPRVVASRWLYEEVRRLPSDILRAVKGQRGDPVANRLRHLVGQAVNLRLDSDALRMRWADDAGDVSPHEALNRLQAVIYGHHAEIRVPHSGPLGVAVREHLAVRFGSLLRLDRGQENGRSTWTLSVVHPQYVSILDVAAAVAGLYPKRVRATGLQTTGDRPFLAAKEAFRLAEQERRSRGEPTSRLSLVRPYNYIDIGTGDSYDLVAQRLLNCGLRLEQPHWIDEDRLVVVSRRPVS